MVKSKLSTNINYQETNGIDPLDDGLERDIVVIDDLMENNIEAVIGNPNKEYVNTDEVVYFNVYGVNKDNLKKIGVIEHNSDDLIELLEDGNSLAYNKLNPPLMFSFVTKEYLNKFKYEPNDYEDSDTDEDVVDVGDEQSDEEEVEESDSDEGETESETESDEEDGETESETESDEEDGEIEGGDESEEETSVNVNLKERTQQIQTPITVSMDEQKETKDNKKSIYDNILKRHEELKMMRKNVLPGTVEYKGYIQRLNRLKEDINNYKKTYA